MTRQEKICEYFNEEYHEFGDDPNWPHQHTSLKSDLIFILVLLSPIILLGILGLIFGFHSPSCYLTGPITSYNHSAYPAVEPAGVDCCNSGPVAVYAC